MWWLVMLLKCCLQSCVHCFANCQTQNLAKTICCRKKHGKNPSIQLSPFKRAPFKGKWHKPCKSKAMCMHLKWNQCIHVCLSVWAGCIFSQLLSVGCSGEIAAAAEVKAVSAMMNAWLLFNWLTTLSRHTPASQQTTWFKMKQRITIVMYFAGIYSWQQIQNTKQGCIFCKRDESTLKQTNWIQLRLPIKPIICWNSDNQNFKTLWRGEASNERPSKQSI